MNANNSGITFRPYSLAQSISKAVMKWLTTFTYTHYIPAEQKSVKWLNLNHRCCFNIPVFFRAALEREHNLISRTSTDTRWTIQTKRAEINMGETTCMVMMCVNYMRQQVTNATVLDTRWGIMWHYVEASWLMTQNHDMYRLISLSSGLRRHDSYNSWGAISIRVIPGLD